MTNYTEQGVVFTSGDTRLIGIVNQPRDPLPTAVLILVGGPQYRVGSHRQFTLLARHLGEAGIASLRFDYSGMGDSEGERIGFDQAQNNIDDALATLKIQVPNLQRIVLWGLCDAASTAMMLAHTRDDVDGLILLNPWVHDGEHSPQVRLSHYYRPRLLEGSNWRRFFNRQVKLGPALREFGRAAGALFAGGAGNTFANQPFVQAMLQGLQDFRGKSLVILSEDDLTAKEFTALVSSESAWQNALASDSVQMDTIIGADHTFSDPQYQKQVADMTVAWLTGLG